MNNLYCTFNNSFLLLAPLYWLCTFNTFTESYFPTCFVSFGKLYRIRNVLCWLTFNLFSCQFSQEISTLSTRVSIEQTVPIHFKTFGNSDKFIGCFINALRKIPLYWLLLFLLFEVGKHFFLSYSVSKTISIGHIFHVTFYCFPYLFILAFCEFGMKHKNSIRYYTACIIYKGL